jgi:hypothetical protein
VNEYVQATNTNTMNPGNSDFTGSIWYKTDDAGGEMFLYHKRSGGGNGEYGLVIDGTTLTAFVEDKEADSALASYTNAVVNDGEWHHVAVTWDTSAGLLTVYLDAVSVATATNTAVGSVGPGAALYFGASQDDDRYFVGNLDEPSLWKGVAMSLTEVEELYNNGVPNDLSQHTHEAELVHWWRNGDGDTFPTLTDNAGARNGTMTNMEAGDIVQDSPS